MDQKRVLRVVWIFECSVHFTSFARKRAAEANQHSRIMSGRSSKVSRKGMSMSNNPFKCHLVSRIKFVLEGKIRPLLSFT